MVMRSPRRILALWVLLLGFVVAVPAAQASIVTVTASGVITSEVGDRSLITGDPGSSPLVDRSFTITQIFTDDLGGGLFAGYSLNVLVDGVAPIAFTGLSGFGLIQIFTQASPGNKVGIIAQGGGADANAVTFSGLLSAPDADSALPGDRSFADVSDGNVEALSLGFTFESSDGSIALNAGNITSLSVRVTEVPEPGSLALLALGAAGLLLVRRRNPGAVPG